MSCPVEVLLHHLPSVAAKAENEWAVEFASSIVWQSKRPNWHPSPKQIGIMRRLVADLLTEDADAVIEDFE